MLRSTDTIPKPDGLAWPVPGAASNQNRTGIEQRPDAVHPCSCWVRGLFEQLLCGVVEEGVDGREQGPLLIEGQALNLLHAPDKPDAGLLGRLLRAALLAGL